MKYGAMNFPVLPVISEIETFAALGFDYLELTLDAPEAHYTGIRRQRANIQRTLSVHNLGLVCHMPTFVHAADLTESIRRASVEELLASLDTAAELGATKAVLHPPHLGGLAPLVRDTALEYAYESLEVMVGRAGDLGITLCLENMMPGAGAFYNPADFDDLFKRFPACKLTLDTGHAHIGAGSSQKLLDFIRRFGDRIGHVHLSDNSGKGDEHLPLGCGRIDFHRVFEALAEAGYDDTVTLEIFTQDRFFLKLSRERFAALAGER